MIKDHTKQWDRPTMKVVVTVEWSMYRVHTFHMEFCWDDGLWDIPTIPTIKLVNRKIYTSTHNFPFVCVCVKCGMWKVEDKILVVAKYSFWLSSDIWNTTYNTIVIVHSTIEQRKTFFIENEWMAFKTLSNVHYNFKRFSNIQNSLYSDLNGTYRVHTNITIGCVYNVQH